MGIASFSHIACLICRMFALGTVSIVIVLPEMVFISSWMVSAGWVAGLGWQAGGRKTVRGGLLESGGEGVGVAFNQARIRREVWRIYTRGSIASQWSTGWVKCVGDKARLVWRGFRDGSR